MAYDKTEYEAVLAAAAASGHSPTSFVADAAVAVARGSTAPEPRNRDAVIELMSARTQLRRYGNNLNQVARVLNAGGQTPEWLWHSIRLTNEVVDRIDVAVRDLVRTSVSGRDQ